MLNESNNQLANDNIPYLAYSSLSLFSSHPSMFSSAIIDVQSDEIGSSELVCINPSPYPFHLSILEFIDYFSLSLSLSLSPSIAFSSTNVFRPHKSYFSELKDENRL